MHTDDIDIDGEQMECPNCGKPLNVDLRPVNISDGDREPKKDRIGVIALCCNTELECDAETFIDLLPETKEN